MRKGIILINRRSKGRRRLFKKKTEWRSQRTPKREATLLIRNELKTDAANVKQIKLPKQLIKTAENKMGAKFDKQPMLFVYFPKRGRRFGKKKDVYRWAGMAIVPQQRKIVTGGPVYTSGRAFVIIPKSHLKDEHVKNAILLHELGEVLAVQEDNKRPTTHQRALQLERSYEKRIGKTRTGILNRSRALFNNPESWK